MNDLTPDQLKFLSLAIETEKLQADLKEKYQELKESMELLGKGTFIQDPETMVVYQITTPTGHYVEFRTIDYNRTKLEGERAGSLSMKAAEAAGFTLSK